MTTRRERCRQALERLRIAKRELVEVAQGSDLSALTRARFRYRNAAAEVAQFDNYEIQTARSVELAEAFAADARSHGAKESLVQRLLNWAKSRA
jgi:hypothetical protein